MKPAFLLYCDDSGGEEDAVRAVAAVSGPAPVLLALERELRRVLALEGVAELKWSALRTRPTRLRVAQAFLELCAVALAAGGLRVDLLLWCPDAQGLAYRRRTESGRLRPLYHQAWSRAVAAWPVGRWRLIPDQRTGMRWRQWPAPLTRRFQQGGRRLLAVEEAASQRSACVQLADLLAGLARLGMEPALAARPGRRRVQGGAASQAPEAPGQAAHRNRHQLLERFRDALRRRGVIPPRGPGLLNSRHPFLWARLLKRLPVQA